MTELIETVPASALAVYAHPDDADVACGGTLSRWAAQGCVVHLVVCTDGGKGTRDPEADPKEVAARRADELAEAAACSGLSGHHVLGHHDGELAHDTSLVGELVHWIRRLRPEVALGHDPTAVFFGQDYFNHRDHRTAGWAFLDALAPAAALPHYFPEAGPPHQVREALLSGTLCPDVWVDVSTSIERKVAAVECHRSQFSADAEERAGTGNGPSGLARGAGWAGEAVRRRAAEEGRRVGVRSAEGFRRLRLGA